MKKMMLSLVVLFSSASVFAQINLSTGSSVVLGGVTVNCNATQDDKAICMCIPMGDNNEFMMAAQYSNGMSQNLGVVKYRAVCDMQIASNPICKK